MTSCQCSNCKDKKNNKIAKNKAFRGAYSRGLNSRKDIIERQLKGETWESIRSIKK